MNTNQARSRPGALSGWVVPALAVTLLASGCGLGSPDVIVTPTGGSGPGVTQSAAPGQDNAPQETSSSGTATSGSATTEAPSGVPDVTATGGVIAGLVVHARDAAATALSEHQGTSVISIDLDRHRGRTVWEIDLVAANGKREVKVDAVDGTIVADEAEHTDDLAKHLARVGETKLDHAQAIDAILAAQPGAALVDLGLDSEHGRLVWDAEVVTPDHLKFEVEIDAVTGEVLKNRQAH